MTPSRHISLISLLLTLGVGTLLVSGSIFSGTETTATENAVAKSVEAQVRPNWKFPIERKIDNASIIFHAPQVVSWDNFKTARLLIAAEAIPTDGSKSIYATIRVSGETKVDLDERIVTLSTPTVDKVWVLNEENSSYREKVQSLIKRNSLDIPLDIFLISLADNVLEVKSEIGFNVKPPSILIKKSPTMLLYINGDPVLAEMPGTEYKVVVNANWPLIHDEKNDTFFLLSKRTWISSKKLSGPWSTSKAAPENIDKLDPEGPYATFRVSKQHVSNVPALTTVTEPTELIVIDGEPKFEAFSDIAELSFVSNTQSPLFNLKNEWYFLTAGRWFKSPELNESNWSLVTDLPDEFSQIPEDHGLAYVRSSIAGTLEARTAILEATLPIPKEVAVNQPLEIDSKFDGEPRFEAITDTKLSRAVNTTHDIILYQGVYYLCYEGAWYQSDTPNGPWIAAFRVPSNIYNIPASSASYHVTQVVVVTSSPSYVTYSHTSAYSSGIYIAYGIPVYGTGWYYPPYYGYNYYGYPSYHHHHYYSYGYGSFYNPNTGNYGTRSTWYGPYGGYSYNQHYSPRTGRSGYVETAWNSNGWASYGETYNPRTGIRSETSRDYNDDRQRFNMEREIEQGNRSLKTEREVDINDGWATSHRETGKGGTARIDSERQANGSITSQGSIRAADGRTAELNQTIQHGKRKTEITGSEGGQLNSVGNGKNRGFVGETKNGDLYAGKNGKIYKKTNNGWQHYDKNRNNWDSIGSGVSNSNKNAAKGKFNNYSNSRSTIQNKNRQSHNYSNLNRHSKARLQGTQQFNNRRSTSKSSAGRRRSGTRSGRGGRRN